MSQRDWEGEARAAISSSSPSSLITKGLRSLCASGKLIHHLAPPL